MNKAPAETAPLGTLRAAFERTGSPHWIMYCIQRLGLDRKQGFSLVIDYLDDQMRGDRHATEAALVEGRVDFIDTDWLTLARCRHQGLKVSAIYPYGRILGGLVVPPASPIQSLTDLAGRRLGVVSQLDKNWTLTRAYVLNTEQLDLKTAVTLAEAGSKTRLKQWLDEGCIDAGLVYWHQIPFLTRQQEYRLLLDVPDVLPALGLAPTPTTFFVFRDRFIAERPQLVRAFIKSFEQALDRLHRDDALWQAIAEELLGIDDPALLDSLRQTWLTRMPGRWDRAAIEELALLSERVKALTGDALGQTGDSGGSGPLPEGCFSWQFMQRPLPETLSRERDIR